MTEDYDEMAGERPMHVHAQEPLGNRTCKCTFGILDIIENRDAALIVSLPIKR